MTRTLKTGKAIIRIKKQKLFQATRVKAIENEIQ